MSYEKIINIFSDISNGYILDTNEIEDIGIFDTAIKALEKQAFFENEVEEISDWFVNNKDCLLNSAMIVARNGFDTLNSRDLIDKVDLDNITEDIVDEIQKGILNVLDTFKGAYKDDD